MLRNLVTGKLSLPMTFWGWGFCGGLFIGVISLLGVRAGFLFLIPAAYLLKLVLFSAVLSGLTFILRRKITILGSVAFLIVLSQVIMAGVMAIAITPMLFK